MEKKRERDSENETNINMNKKSKTDDHCDIILSSSLHNKEETPWVKATLLTLSKIDKDEIEGKY